jgi:hypothetical protein
MMIFNYTIPQNGKWQEKSDQINTWTNLPIIILNLQILSRF